jgi:hypothetical protein
LAERGFVTFAPHNPYRGGDAFRTLQRKLNPLGLTLFSVIIGQHQRILAWLREQPFAEPDRIAFYGLSYGGKSAMRIPAVLTDYCLSICSGDFNEWVRYCVSTDLPIPGSMHAGEYEIWEWNKAAFANGGDQLPASQATSMNHSLVTSGSEPAANAGPSSQPERPRQEPARLGCQTVSCPLPRPLEGNRERDRRR